MKALSPTSMHPPANRVLSPYLKEKAGVDPLSSIVPFPTSSSILLLHSSVSEESLSPQTQLIIEWNNPTLFQPTRTVAFNPNQSSVFPVANQNSMNFSESESKMSAEGER